MLRFYHLPLSANSRRVWIALLEKGLAFEEVLLKLDGEMVKTKPCSEAIEASIPQAKALMKAYLT